MIYHLLLNINNKVFFAYELLFGYLHQFLEGRNHLASFHRYGCGCVNGWYNSLRNTEFCLVHCVFRALSLNAEVFSGSKTVAYSMLRRGWDGFIRLLQLDWMALFICPLCGPEPKIVVCDGTALGFRKYFLRVNKDQPATTNVVLRGTRHKDRVFVRNAKAQ